MRKNLNQIPRHPTGNNNNNPTKQIQNRSILQNNINNNFSQEQMLDLQYIIGLTNNNNKHSVIFNKVNGNLFYTSGSIVVEYDISKNEQVKFYISKNKRPITSICFSSDDRYLITGEGVCKNPEIIIWDTYQTAKNTDTKQNQQNKLNLGHKNSHNIVQTNLDISLKGHKFGTSILLFSPNGKYLVSIGDCNDRGLFVWDYKHQTKITQNKLSKAVNSATFSPNSRHLVTVGNQHFKFWDFNLDGTVIKTEAKDKKGAFILDGKTPNLGQKFQKKEFQDCCFSEDSNLLFAITKCGCLAIIDVQTRVLGKWMDLKVENAYSIVCNNTQVIIGCSDGIIRVFSQKNLEHICTLPKPPPLMGYNIEKKNDVNKQQKIAIKNTDKYADCIAVRYDKKTDNLSAIYSDRTVFIWDISQIDKSSIKRSFLSHCGAINDLEILQSQSSEEVSFFSTVSSDQTVRIWNFFEQDNQGGENEDEEEDIQAYIDNNIRQNGIRRNLYCRNLNQIIYINKNIKQFKAQNNTDESIQQQNNEIQIKNIKTSSDGKYICVGDDQGALRIYQISDFKLIYTMESHDQEITCLDFTPKNDLNVDLCASGSRDRLIHVYDKNNNFNHICTLGDHSSSIISLKFIYIKKLQKMYLVSCGTDKILIFRELVNTDFNKNISNAQYNPSHVFSQQIFKLIHKQVDKTNKFLSIQASYDKEQIFTGQEKGITTFKTKTGEQVKQNETKYIDSLTGKNIFLDNQKMALDSSGTYVAVSNGDKFIRIREIQNQFRVVAKIGIGEQVTGLAFSHSNKYLIVVTVEGLIYTYKLTKEISSVINKKTAALGQIAKHLQNLLAEQEFLQSKEWNINTFWIEDELKHQFSTNNRLSNVSNITKNDSTNNNDMTPLNAKNIMVSKDLPIWAQQQKNNYVDDATPIIPLNQDYLNEKQEIINKKNLPSWAMSLEKQQSDLQQQQQQQQKDDIINQSDVIIAQNYQENKQFHLLSSQTKSVTNNTNLQFEGNVSIFEDNDDEEENKGYQQDQNDQYTESQVYPPPPDLSKQNKYSDIIVPNRNTISKLYKSKHQSTEVEQIDNNNNENHGESKNLDDDDNDDDDNVILNNNNAKSIFDPSKIQNQMDFIEQDMQNIEDKMNKQNPNSFKMPDFNMFNSEIKQNFMFSENQKLEESQIQGEDIMLEIQDVSNRNSMQPINNNNSISRNQSSVHRIDRNSLVEKNVLEILQRNSQINNKNKEEVEVNKQSQQPEQESKLNDNYQQISTPPRIIPVYNGVAGNYFEDNHSDIEQIQQRQKTNIQNNFCITPPNYEKKIRILNEDKSEENKKRFEEEGLEVPGSSQGFNNDDNNKLNFPFEKNNSNVFINSNLNNDNNTKSQQQETDNVKNLESSIPSAALQEEEISTQQQKDIQILPLSLQQSPDVSAQKILQQQNQQQQQQLLFQHQKNPENTQQELQFEDYQNQLQNSIQTIVREMQKMEKCIESVQTQKGHDYKDKLVGSLNNNISNMYQNMEKLDQSGFHFLEHSRQQQQQSQQQQQNQQQIQQNNNIFTNSQQQSLIANMQQQQQQQSIYKNTQNSSINSNEVSQSNIFPNQSIHESMMGDMLQNYSNQLLQIVKQNMQKEQQSQN